MGKGYSAVDTGSMMCCNWRAGFVNWTSPSQIPDASPLLEAFAVQLVTT